jgi:tetratricopeptide (TPR) repeat protein
LGRTSGVDGVGLLSGDVRPTITDMRWVVLVLAAAGAALVAPLLGQSADAAPQGRAVAMAPPAATGIDALWNYDDPAGAEAKFRAYGSWLIAAGDHAGLMELDTQIARAEGLQGRFDDATKTLQGVRAGLRVGEARAEIRYELELGRVLRSSGHPDDARPHFVRARTLADAARQDALSADARHMLVLVEADPARQVTAGLDALAFAEASRDPGARWWRGPVLHNLGMSYHDLGRLDDALKAFQHDLAVREEEHDAGAVLVARFSIAWIERLQGRLSEALAEEEALERVHANGYVYEELGEIHLAMASGNQATAQRRLAQDYFTRAYALLKNDPGMGEDELVRMKRLAEER